MLFFFCRVFVDGWFVYIFISSGFLISWFVRGEKFGVFMDEEFGIRKWRVVDILGFNY